MNSIKKAALRAMAFASALVFVLCAMPAKASASPIVLVTVKDGDTRKEYTTRADTIREFLDEAGIKLGRGDVTVPPDTEKVTYGMRLEIIRGIEVSVSINGAESKMKILRGITVGKFAADLGRERGEKYIVKGSLLTETVREFGAYVLVTSNEATETDTRVIPYATEYVETAELEKGAEQILTPGAPGEFTITETVTYQGGEEVSRKTVSSGVTRVPVNEVVLVGTHVTPPRPEPQPAPEPERADTSGWYSTTETTFTYTMEYDMTATCYTIDGGGKDPGDPGYGYTASGIYVRRGLVAVDPKVIPLGTKLYVEGYGYALAADTGGAIKGMKIDLYVETEWEAYQFGRRPVKVYVLKNQG